MKSIIYRTIEPKDYPQISQMLRRIWQFDRYIQEEDVAQRAGEAFFLSYLARQNYMEIAERDGEILGILLGHCLSLPFSKEQKKWETESSRKLFWFLHSKKGKKFFDVQRRTAKYEAQLLDPYKGQFDAELVLFATSENARGLGIGKILLSHFNAFLEEQQAKRVFLFTDSFCNFGFYEHLGYHRTAELDAFLGIEEDPNKPMSFYLYTYDIV